jgi:hypothetical protein
MLDFRRDSENGVSELHYSEVLVRFTTRLLDLPAARIFLPEIARFFAHRNIFQPRH